MLTDFHSHSIQKQADRCYWFTVQRLRTPTSTMRGTYDISQFDEWLDMTDRTINLQSDNTVESPEEPRQRHDINKGTENRFVLYTNKVKESRWPSERGCHDELNHQWAWAWRPEEKSTPNIMKPLMISINKVNVRQNGITHSSSSNLSADSRRDSKEVVFKFTHWGQLWLKRDIMSCMFRSSKTTF